MRKVIFLDRDGTINVDRGYVHRVDEWEWEEGAVEALKKLQGAGFTLAIVTNQSAIGHGKYAVEDMQALHEFMNAELAKQGVALDAVAFCPHRRDGTCDCRKPKIGMAKQVEERIGPIDYARSWSIGDKIADMQFGKALGAHTALIHSRYWEEKDFPAQPDLIVESLAEAVEKIVTSNQ